MSLLRPTLSTLLSVVVLLAGVASGVPMLLDSSRTAPGHDPTASAWGVHIGLTAVAVLLAAGYLVALHTRDRPWRVSLPWNRDTVPDTWQLILSASARPSAAARAPIAVLAHLLIGYLLWRIGLQILGGLDPAFTADAWGGPGYWGALYCHVLDSGLVIAVVGAILSAVLPTDATGGNLRTLRGGAR